MSRWVGLTLGIVLAATGCASGAEPGARPAAVAQAAAPAQAVAAAPRTQTMATGLAVPWGLAFLPDGTALVTLRDRGVVLRVGQRPTPVSVGRMPGFKAGGEGGLLGIAVSPSFASNRTLFAYSPRRSTTGSSG